MLFVTLVAALLRLAAWLPGVENPTLYEGGDTDEYQAVADDVAAAYGGVPGLAQDLGLRRPPGYPLLLATVRTVSDRLPWVALWQVVYGLLLVVSTGYVGRQLFGAAEGLIAAAWVALDPLLVVHSSVLLTETPFAVLLLLSLHFVQVCVETEGTPWVGALLAGFALAAATFVRPISLYLPLLMVPVLIVLSPRGKRRWVAAAVFTLATLLPVAAWMARNHAVSGEVIFSTIEGASMLDYRAAGTLEEAEGIGIEEARQRVRALAAAETGEEMNAAERSRVASRVGLEVVIDHPVAYAKMAARGAAMTLFGPGTAVLSSRVGETGGEPALLVLVSLSAASAVALVLLAALAPWVASRRRNWGRLLPVAVPLLYLLAIGSGQESYSRFRVPLVPLLALLAALTVVHYARGWTARWRPSPADR